MRKKLIQPLFILSLPRSGSTLLQRILGNHPKIHTVSEPWLLLPLFGAIKPIGTYAGYSHKDTCIALNEFIQHLPNGEEDLYECICQSILNIYQKICLNEKRAAKYFLDKTPRYHLIIDQINRAFPDAKIILLMRDPLSVIASMLRTSPIDTWNLYLFNIDLFEGLINILDFQRNKSSSFLKVNYENLLKNPNKELSEIYSYLEVEIPGDDICLKSNRYLKGRMGDRVSTLKENIFNLDSIDKWKNVINNPIRKIWCIRYIKWVGKDRLNEMGYDMDLILNSLYTTDVSINIKMFKDLYRIIFGVFYSIFEYTIIKDNFKRFARIFQAYAKT